MIRTIAAALLVAALAVPMHAQPAGPPAQVPGQADPFGRFLFPPELVMQHQGSIGLTEPQREALQAAIQEAQTTVLKMQFALSGEAERVPRAFHLAPFLDHLRFERGLSEQTLSAYRHDIVRMVDFLRQRGQEVPEAKGVLTRPQQAADVAQQQRPQEQAPCYFDLLIDTGIRVGIGEDDANTDHADRHEQRREKAVGGAEWPLPHPQNRSKQEALKRPHEYDRRANHGNSDSGG